MSIYASWRDKHNEATREGVSLFVPEQLPINCLWPLMTSHDLHMWPYHLHRYSIGHRQWSRSSPMSRVITDALICHNSWLAQEMWLFEFYNLTKPSSGFDMTLRTRSYHVTQRSQALETFRIPFKRLKDQPPKKSVLYLQPFMVQLRTKSPWGVASTPPHVRASVKNTALWRSLPNRLNSTWYQLLHHLDKI